MALLPLLSRTVGRALFLPAHGRGAALPRPMRQLLQTLLPFLPHRRWTAAAAANGVERWTARQSGGGWRRLLLLLCSDTGK